MKPIGVAILGTGRISDLHAIEYLRSDAARIVAVCDQLRDLAAAKAEAWGVPDSRTFTTLDALLACDEVDLVEVLLPHDQHLPATLAALAAGTPQAAALACACSGSRSQTATMRASALRRYSIAWRSEIRPAPRMPTPIGRIIGAPWCAACSTIRICARSTA